MTSLSILDRHLDSVYTYGTAGFRLNDHNQQLVLQKSCVIAMILSIFYGKKMGAMITASHNPHDYNGIKIIRYDGFGLTSEEERRVEKLLNGSFEELVLAINEAKSNSLPQFNNDSIKFNGFVVLGRDTRKSGEECIRVVKEIFESMGCDYLDLGIVTTPQLHFEVKRINEQGLSTAQNYKAFLSGLFPPGKKIFIDTANGSAGSFFKDQVDFEVINPNQSLINKEQCLINNEQCLINHKCGTEYFLSNLQLPFGRDKAVTVPCAVFDGDADRLAMLVKSGDDYCVLDGDDLAVLLCDILFPKLQKYKDSLKMGVVLSYYSNGASVKYLKSRGFDVFLVGAGVKNFIGKSQSLDVSIWFEPNGHGGIHFSEKAMKTIDVESDQVLKTILTVYKSVFGDAIANLLVISSFSEQMGVKYTKMPCKLGAIKIKDKNMVKITEDYLVTEPKELCEYLKQMNSDSSVRTFVRASGTENIVRIYVECEKAEELERIYEEIEMKTKGICNSVEMKVDT